MKVNPCIREYPVGSDFVPYRMRPQGRLLKRAQPKPAPVKKPEPIIQKIFSNLFDLISHCPKIESVENTYIKIKEIT